MCKDNIVLVCSGGGHLTEGLKAMPDIIKNRAVIITALSGHNDQTLAVYRRYFVVDPHTSVLKYGINFLQSVILYLKTRPKYIISTGAGIAIAFVIIGKVFGSKIIFIESGARVSTPSRTGQLLFPISDLFIVQSKHLLKYYPTARVGSL